MSRDPKPAPPSSTQPGLGLVMPGVFVFLWSTGFIFAKLAMPHAAPTLFLAVRFAIAAALLALLALAFRAPWPSPRLALHAAGVGLLLQATYLGGVFASIKLGMPAGVSALIVSLQPLLTGVLVGPLLGDRIARTVWIGLLLGLAGVAAVLWDRLAFDGITLASLSWSIAALLGITLATLWQKRLGSAIDLRTGSCVQFVASAVVLGALAPLLGQTEFQPHPELWIALAWSSVVLSVGAIALYTLLIRRGDAARVASVMYLVPPTTAAMAWVLFGEQLGIVGLIGVIVVATGVALVNRR
ncbi:MAG: DMT family transporter [Alphaproteobacteria bacterium]|nr:MAG: DMT family transporter [Alphaproteobacteria bacterium]